jgi:hypothetical protein
VRPLPPPPPMASYARSAYALELVGRRPLEVRRRTLNFERPIDAALAPARTPRGAAGTGP